MARTKQHLIAGIDIGTANVVALIGEKREDNSIHVVGYGCQPSRGLKRGVVVNIEATVAAIRAAMEEAELMADCQVDEVYATISGSHIRSLNSHGIVAIRQQEVNHYDIERVIDAAKAIPIGSDRQILHVLPQEFMVDSQEDIKEPIGMTGVRLEARVHVVTAADSALQNIIKCLQQCGLRVNKMILGHIAASHAVLTRDERDLGVCLVDIGAGTTNIAIYVDGALRHTAVIPIAGDQVTNDIAVALRTPTRNAEEIKKRHACTLSCVEDANQMIDVPAITDQQAKQITRKYLARVVEARMEELLLLVKSELMRSGFMDLVTTGLVMTGGSTLTAGLDSLAERVFAMPARSAKPVGISGLNDILQDPIYADAIGLLLYAAEEAGSSEGVRGVSSGHHGQSVFARVKSWVSENL